MVQVFILACYGCQSFAMDGYSLVAMIFLVLQPSVWPSNHVLLPGSRGCSVSC